MDREKTPLDRPQRLKSWSLDLIRMVREGKDEAFADWEFGPGRLTALDLSRCLEKAKDCASLLELRAKLDHETGEMSGLQVHAGNYCGQHAICPVCAGRVQDRRGARFSEAIQAAARAHRRAYLITATIPPRPSWREDLGHLIQSWQNFRRMGQKRVYVRKDGSVKVTHSGGEWAKVEAGLAKIEIKRGSESGLPHCHIHALIFTDKPLDFRVWSKEEKQKERGERKALYYVTSPENGELVPASKISWEWFKASGGATSIEINPITHKEAHRKAGKTFAESVWLQSREVLKYATKFDSYPERGQEKLFIRDYVEIRDATYNRRLFNTYGEFRSVPGDDYTGDLGLEHDPVIFETRWRGLDYSRLEMRAMPVFKDRDGSPESLHRIRTGNRVLGQVRRIRSAIFKAKETWRKSGHIVPACYEIPSYDGGEPQKVYLEPTAEIISNPSERAFEAWLDEYMILGREFYGQTIDRLRLEGLDRLDGTLEMQMAWNAMTRRFYWQTKERKDTVIEDFIRTLAETRAGPW